MFFSNLGLWLVNSKSILLKFQSQYSYKIYSCRKECSQQEPYFLLSIVLRISPVQILKLAKFLEGFKVLTIITLSIVIFFTFSYKISFPKDLAKFKSIRIIRTLPCCMSCLRIWVNDIIFSKIPHGLKL